MFLTEWIHKKLSEKLFQKRQDVLRLKWKKAELEKMLDKVKKDSELITK